jgi:DNA-binding XRE family transcriptional regulator
VNETDTLRGLIAKARRERELSVRQLALVAKEAGHRIVGTTLNAIEAGTYKSVPSIETIRAIGWLAKVSDEIAFTAAGRAVPGPPFAEELPPGVDDLTSPERKAAIVMLRALVAQRQELNRYVDQSDDDHSAAATGTSGEENEDQEAIVLPMVARTVDDEPKPE